MFHKQAQFIFVLRLGKIKDNPKKEQIHWHNVSPEPNYNGNLGNILGFPISISLIWLFSDRAALNNRKAVVKLQGLFLQALYTYMKRTNPGILWF